MRCRSRQTVRGKARRRALLVGPVRADDPSSLYIGLSVEALVVLCHPERESYNAAVAQRVCAALRAAGHAVRFHDLYAERFDPVLSASELRRGYSFDSQVQSYGNELESCEALVFVHPEWWGAPPAVLKGWIDRVFRPGLAYEFEGDEFASKRKRGLLAAKRAIVFATTEAGEPEIQEGRAPLEIFWRESVFGYCGLEASRVHLLYGLRERSAVERNAWLDFVADAAPAWLAAATVGHPAHPQYGRP
jgi:NAD(P)H dehydrogenase (quinone)